ncbi:DUF3806 domain-containing protein [Cellulomonas soli]|uniref:DUF3806 domain-containing protein n=1 Tax=Cellulomonas soli TaxID=931535 RepID=A0A512PF48_9CELL|nr:DUF3806 domain-containing protein [Cellulomonas soli]NYI59377.1 hypothetical protein [Cellulomonas soli]GEP69834.1 hypothetical protein CSO01_25490 [Cellulomonas soli]
MLGDEPVLPPAALPDGDLEALNDAELVWAAQHRELVTGLCEGQADVETLSRLFDRVQAGWLASADRDDPHTLVNAFGIALGDLLVSRLPGMRWQVYTDARGPELVLAHPVHDLVVFPISSVARQWGHAPEDWFARYADDVTEGARAILGDGS